MHSSSDQVIFSKTPVPQKNFKIIPKEVLALLKSPQAPALAKNIDSSAEDESDSDWEYWYRKERP